MNDYRTGFIPSVLIELDDLLDMVNDTMFDEHKEESLIKIATYISLLRERIRREYVD